MRIRDRRRVHNPLGCAHAIALCNLAELSAGVVTDATLPCDMRWIPEGMTVDCLKKAVATLHGVATPRTAARSAVDGHEWPSTCRLLMLVARRLFVRAY